MQTLGENLEKLDHQSRNWDDWLRMHVGSRPPRLIRACLRALGSSISMIEYFPRLITYPTKDQRA